MAKVNSIPGLNLATFFAGIVMLCLVEGLMPRRAALSDTANVPKPTNDTLSPAFRAFVIDAMKASNAS